MPGRGIGRYIADDAIGGDIRRTVMDNQRPRSRLWRALLIAYREMFEFAGFGNRAVNAALAPLFVLPSLLFVLRLIGLDRRLVRTTLPSAMSWVLRRYYPGVSLVSGTFPAGGPVLFAGNHPGLGDLPALAVLAGRDDLVAVAKKRPLMRDFHGILDRCIVIDDGLASRAAAIRSIISTFRSGGAVVIYPAGEIESDPAVFSQQRMLREWLPFVDTIARRAEREGLDVPVVPVYTEGVHRVPRLFRFALGRRVGQEKKEGRAALITMMTSFSRSAPIRIAVGSAAEVTDSAAGGQTLTNAVRSALLFLHESVACSGARGTDAPLQRAAQFSDVSSSRFS